MPEYTEVQWLFFFYFYSFFGWCFESTYVSLKERKLVNRGFMRGTFLPSMRSVKFREALEEIKEAIEEHRAHKDD